MLSRASFRMPKPTAVSAEGGFENVAAKHEEQVAQRVHAGHLAVRRPDAPVRTERSYDGSHADQFRSCRHVAILPRA